MAEIVAQRKREEKRKKRRFRKSKPTHIEEVRCLVELQMQALKQFLNTTNDNKRHSEEYHNNEHKGNDWCRREHGQDSRVTYRASSSAKYVKEFQYRRYARSRSKELKRAYRSNRYRSPINHKYYENKSREHKPQEKSKSPDRRSKNNQSKHPHDHRSKRCRSNSSDRSRDRSAYFGSQRSKHSPYREKYRKFNRHNDDAKRKRRSISREPSHSKVYKKSKHSESKSTRNPSPSCDNHYRKHKDDLSTKTTKHKHSKSKKKKHKRDHS